MKCATCGKNFRTRGDVARPLYCSKECFEIGMGAVESPKPKLMLSNHKDGIVRYQLTASFAKAMKLAELWEPLSKVSLSHKIHKLLLDIERLKKRKRQEAR